MNVNSLHENFTLSSGRSLVLGVQKGRRDDAHHDLSVVSHSAAMSQKSGQPLGWLY